ncbi:hypothetical protein A0H81_10578 [Grifola frondosa]|uniref:Uncharacterized protein n=1 Tax=Grifola frondosa TaxID=5627 RepID=A0A1C7LXP3_GRIFR|nr:hypothetical protein A0H81_10578 [Grifola frondosa]
MRSKIMAENLRSTYLWATFVRVGEDAQLIRISHSLRQELGTPCSSDAVLFSQPILTIRIPDVSYQSAYVPFQRHWGYCIDSDGQTFLLSRLYTPYRQSLNMALEMNIIYTETAIVFDRLRFVPVSHQEYTLPK